MKKLVVFLAFVFVLVSSQSSFAAYKWRAVTHSSPGTEQLRIFEEFADTVKVLSKGELVIDVFAAGVLFPVFETFDNVANGVVDASMVFSAYWTGKDPVFNFSTRPGCPIGTFAEAAYLDQQLEKWWSKLYSKHGLKYLGYMEESPIYEQLMSRVPLRSMADLKGKKIRTSGFSAMYYRSMGATTVSLSGPEIYTAFQTKNIDAAEYTFWDENMKMGFHEVVKYVVDPALHNGTCDYAPLVVNPKKWEELPQHLKDVVIVARDRARFSSAMILVDEMKAREKWKAMPGMEIIRWSDKDLKDARALGMKMILDESNKSAEGKEFVKIYSKTLFELGYKDEAKVLGYKK